MPQVELVALVRPGVALVDGDGNLTLDFNQSITNNSTFTQTVAAVSTATAATTGDSITLTFSEEINTGDRIKARLNKGSLVATVIEREDML